MLSSKRAACHLHWSTHILTLASPVALEILYEDNHLLALAKPAGLATMGVSAGKASLLTLAKQYLKDRYVKPGNVYLGVVSRVDAAVSGIVLFARTSKAAARLSEQFRSRSVEKVYWAIVESRVVPPSGEWVDWMAKDDAQHRMVRANPGAAGAQEARLSYRMLRPAGEGLLVEVRPETGRKHQIRLQFAARGYPIVGDKKYGSRRPFPIGIALHAHELAFDHPTTKRRISLIAPVPATWGRFGLNG
jgi:23S rRNA pseudouridine1911/1915/1917 synthase